MVALGLLFGEELFPDPGDRPNQPEVPLPAIQLDLGPDFGFPGGFYEELGVIRLEWEATTPSFPPDPQAARVPVMSEASEN
jgi:hypothetical protein